MSESQSVTTISRKAAADLSTKQYFAVKIDGNGEVVLAAAGDPAFLLQNKPALGEPAALAINGLAKGWAGATINAGVPVYSDANGKLTSTSGSVGKVAVGIAAEDAVDGQIMEVILAPITRGV